MIINKKYEQNSVECEQVDRGKQLIIETKFQ